jgi:WD40 repeat protein
LSLWDAATGKKVRDMRAGSIPITVESIAFSPDSRYVAAGEGGGLVCVWDVETGSSITYLTKPYGYEWGGGYLSFSPDGRYLASEAGSGYGVMLWDWNADSGRELLGTAFQLESSDHYNVFRIKYQGADIVSYKTWDAEAKRELRAFAGYGYETLRLEYNPNGRQIASYTSRQALVWDVLNGKLVSAVSKQTDSTLRLSRFRDVVSPDKKLIAREQGTGFEVYRTGADPTAKMMEALGIKISGDGADADGLVADGEALYTLPVGDCSVVFSPDSLSIIGPSQNGYTGLWDADTGRELAQFIYYPDDEWIVITPEGWYNASANGDRYLNVRIGDSVFGIEQFRQIYYRPDLVALALSRKQGRSGTTIQNAASFAPPEIVISQSGQSGASRGINFAAVKTAASRKYDLSVTVSDSNQSIKNIRILINGRHLGDDALRGLSGGGKVQVRDDGIAVTGNEKKVEFSLAVDLDQGLNRIEVIAVNGFAEARKTLEVRYEKQTGEIIPQPNLWVLAIGVNGYSNSDIPDLSYCVNDAREIVSTLKKQEGERYAQVHTLLIADGGAISPSAQNIRDNLKFMQGAGSNDAVLFFMAGHGVSEGDGNFFFLPSDAAFTADGSVQKDKAISTAEILSVLNGAGNRLVFIDACHSGGLSSKTSAVDNDRMVRALRDSNAFVFASSKGNELSQERADLKHGVFTYAIIQGLGGAAVIGGGGEVSTAGLIGYVSREVKTMTDEKQRPNHSAIGVEDFVIANTR